MRFTDIVASMLHFQYYLTWPLPFLLRNSSLKGAVLALSILDFFIHITFCCSFINQVDQLAKAYTQYWKKKKTKFSVIINYMARHISSNNNLANFFLQMFNHFKITKVLFIHPRHNSPRFTVPSGHPDLWSCARHTNEPRHPFKGRSACAATDGAYGCAIDSRYVPWLARQAIIARLAFKSLNEFRSL